MTTEDFFRLVLPSQGIYFAAIPRAGHVGQFNHKAFRDLAALAAYTTAMAGHGSNVYFACSSFVQEKYVDDKNKTRRRTQDNVSHARAQWIDLDCGEGKDYPDQRSAMEALAAFLQKTGLPRPTQKISSGHGVHCYWVFDRDVTREQWSKLARVFKAVCRHFGFKQDWTRVADGASVLRAPGTVNAKPGRPVVPVTAIGKTGEPIALKTWVQALSKLQNENTLTVAEAPAPRRAANNDLTGGTEFPPVDPERVADRCQQIRFMRDHRGVGQPEPAWRAALGLLSYCEDGLAKAQEWSSEHEGYDPGATLEKLNAWRQRAGPATCATFQSADADRCAGCKHAGKISSPIVLGFPDPEHTVSAVVEEVVTDEDGNEETQIVEETFPEFPENVAKDFRWTGAQLKGRKTDEDGVSWVPVCDQLPVPLHTYYDPEDNSYKMRIRVWVRGRSWREADISQKAIAAGGTQLLGELGNNAGVVPKGNGADLVRYMRTWSENIQASSEEVTMHQHYGWQEDKSFLLGTSKYLPNGEVREVRLSSSIEGMAKDHTPTGSLDRYVELINHAYNRERHEVYQFTWLASFASPLLHLAHNAPIGIPVVGWSKESGQGKTTAALAGISVWGNPNASNQTANANKATDYALYVMAGLRRNLPVLLDETTLKEAKWLAQMAYDYSDGRPKIQGKASGGLRDNSNLQWSNMMYLTSNKSITETMSATIVDCVPQIARVWEYRYDVSHDDTMTRDEGDRIFHELWQHYGVAGDAYLRYVVPNQEKITALIFKVRDELANTSGVDKSARFWLLGAACVWVAFLITRKLGMQKFNPQGLRTWIETTLAGMTTTAKGANRDILDLFSDMLAEMQGGFIVTNIEGGGRNGAQAVLDPNFGMPRGAIVGRVLTDDRKVYLSQTAVRQWCVERGVSYMEMEAALQAKGWLQHLTKRSLGKGVNSALGQTRCLALDWGVYSSVLAVVPQEQAEQTA